MKWVVLPTEQDSSPEQEHLLNMIQSVSAVPTGETKFFLAYMSL